jgi:protein-S-isoprenylcysteine O-methyltransferase Ste14
LEPRPRYLFPKPYADVVQRLRVASGFVLLVAFGVFADPVAQTMLVGLPISLFGLAIRGWAAGHLAKNEQLATTGPYAFMRNPLYTGTLLTALGIVIACRSFALAAIFLVVFLLVYLPVIELEEQHLRKLFPNYSGYAARVHRFLPLSRWEGREARFSSQLYMKNQEYKAALGFAVALLWMAFRYWFAATLR